MLFLADGNKVRKDNFNPEKFKFLKFLISNFAKGVLDQGKLSTKNFLGLAAACATKQRVIPDAELDKQNDYNLIYCPALYEYEAQTLLDYLKTQAGILLNYTEDEQRKNKRAFIYIDTVTEQDKEARAQEIKQLDDNYIDKLKVTTAEKLNTIEFANIVIGSKKPDTSSQENVSTVETGPIVDNWAAILKNAETGIDKNTLDGLLSNKAAREKLINDLLTKLSAKK